MNGEQLITICGSVLGIFGGWEGVKWLVKYIANRKASQRQEEAAADLHEAEAEKAELDADAKRWELFDRMLLKLEEGLLRKDEVISRKDRVIEEKDRLYAEQTERLRKTQDELLNLHKDHTELKARYIYADTWRCEIGVCKKRRPPKPQLYGLEYDESAMPIKPDEENA